MTHIHHTSVNYSVPAKPAFDAALWSRLQAMQLDNAAASLTFTRRLARENGWSLAYAGDVVEEYRRFLYLAARRGHPVTPSDAVDQAWHLHLTYTRHYWGVLCREVLGFDLHHGPTLGGEREQAKFGDWYARTLESYRAAFGTPPPAHIWPAVTQRFDGVEDFRRIDASAHWVIPKLSLRLRSNFARPALAGPIMIAAAVGLMFYSGSAIGHFAAVLASAQVNVLDWIVLAAVVGAGICWIAYSYVTSGDPDRNKKDNGSGCGGGCSAGAGGGGCGGCGG